MSIATKTGDDGTTGLMYNRRVSKCHPRVEAYACVDELTAALGLARATAVYDFVRDHILAIQKDLIILMGELATSVDDLPRYARDGFSLVTPAMTGTLDRMVAELESHKVALQGWAVPGATVHSAALDLARTACRRAERRVCALQESAQLQNSEIILFLNRLSDALWLLARWVETREEGRKEMEAGILREDGEL